MRIVKTPNFWIGVAVGAFAVPWILSKTRARVPATGNAQNGA